MTDYSVDVISEEQYILKFSGPEHFGKTLTYIKQNYRKFIINELNLLLNIEP